jgi:hypothetical protein
MTATTQPIPANMLATQDRFLQSVYEAYDYALWAYTRWESRYFALPLRSRCQLLADWERNGASLAAAKIAATMVA